MTPFLASSVHIVKKDGSTVDINNDGSPGRSDEDASATVSQTVAPSKKHHSDADVDVGNFVPIVAIVFVFLWLIVKALMAPFTQKATRRTQTPMGGPAEGLSEEEQAVLLKLQRTIVDMERRIESLETILIEEHRNKEKYGTKI